jgi:hypothetical protein
MRMTLGGNLVDYPGNVSVGTAEMETIKLLLNSVVSTPGAAFCSANVTNFYLNTPMKLEEYVRVHISLIPDEIIHEYLLHELIKSKGLLLGCVQKGMYGLPQAGMLAKQLLKQQLGPHGYHECIHTPGLWKHYVQPFMFTLIVDDFGIQFTGKHHAQHLIAALKHDYEAVTTGTENYFVASGLSRTHSGSINARVCRMGTHRLCACYTITKRTSATLAQ